MVGTAGLTASRPGLASRAEPLAQLAPSDRRMADAVRAIALDAGGVAAPGQSAASLRMADVATALWTRFLRFDAADPHWPDRDRFVFAAPGSAALLASLLHLSGVDGLEIGGSAPLPPSGNPGPGAHPAIEAAAGPWSQGLPTAVGLALAERLLAARFGRSLVDHRTWVVAARGDLMDCASDEAIALAGRLRFDKLTVLCESGNEGASGEAACPADALRRFAAHGWAVKQVDGQDPVEIAGAMSFAIRSKKPTFIACRTGRGDSLRVRASLGEDRSFALSETTAERWRAAGRRGAGARRGWLKRLARHPLRPEFERVMAGRLPETWHEGLAALKAELAETRPVLATADASRRAVEALVQALPELVGGSSRSGPDHAASGSFGLVPLGSFGGRFVDFGPREQGLAAAFNGVALHGGLLPYGAAFLASSDYMRPALRAGAAMGRRVIHLLTHDAGEDRLAPLPSDHLASLRAMPGVLVFRPADAVEAAECWELAIRRPDGPSLIILTSQGLPTLRPDAAENRCARGGYVLAEADGPRQATLIATGPEVSVAMAARALLATEGIAVAAVSLPCWELFALQEKAAREQTLGGVPRFGIEAASGFGWDRWLGEDGLFIGAPGPGVSAREGSGSHPFISADAVAASVRKRLGNFVPDIH